VRDRTDGVGRKTDSVTMRLLILLPLYPHVERRGVYTALADGTTPKKDNAACRGMLRLACIKSEPPAKIFMPELRTITGSFVRSAGAARRVHLATGQT